MYSIFLVLIMYGNTRNMYMQIFVSIYLKVKSNKIWSTGSLVLS